MCWQDVLAVAGCLRSSLASECSPRSVVAGAWSAGGSIQMQLGPWRQWSTTTGDECRLSSPECLLFPPASRPDLVDCHCPNCRYADYLQYSTLSPRGPAVVLWSLHWVDSSLHCWSCHHFLEHQHGAFVIASQEKQAAHNASISVCTQLRRYL